jgi:hypothetical protein
MLGWIVQRYGNEPAVVKVKLNRLPGAIVGDAHAPLLAADVCDVLSPFSQLTVVPTETVIGLGEYAVFDSVDAPPTIVTVVLPAGAGSVVEGEGAVVEL